jgi:hypothetical protein
MKIIYAPISLTSSCPSQPVLWQWSPSSMRDSQYEICGIAQVVALEALEAVEAFEAVEAVEAFEL